MISFCCLLYNGGDNSEDHLSTSTHVLKTKKAEVQRKLEQELSALKVCNIVFYFLFFEESSSNDINLHT